MKKITIAVLCLLMTSAISFAQVGKGSKYVNASSSLSFTSMKYTLDYGEGTDEESVSEFSISPSVGFFIMDGLAVGITALYESSKYKYEGIESDPYVVYGLGVFGKYYFGQGAIKPFGKAEVGILGESSGEDDVDKASGMGFGAGAGVAYFLNEFVAVEAGLDYSVANMKNKEFDELELKMSGIQFKVGFTIAF